MVWFGVVDNHLFDARLRVERLEANFGGKLLTRCGITLRRNMEQTTKPNGLLLSFKVASGRALDVCGVRAACRCGGTGVSPSRLTKVTTKRVATRCGW